MTGLDDDLAGQRGPRGVEPTPLEDCALDLAAGDALLDDDLEVVLACGLDRALELVGVVHLGHPHRGPRATGLDEDREVQRLDRVHRRGLVPAPLAVGDHRVRADGQPGTGEDDLHVVLVHARGGGEHARTDIADVGELEHPLQGAVLAVGAVQQREDDVHLTQGLQSLPGAVHGQCALPDARREDHLGAGVGDLRRLRGRERQAPGVVVDEDPATLAGDPHGDDVVDVAVDRPQHAGRGGAGDGVLGGATAEDDGDTGLAIWMAAHRGKTNL